jgi:hypothetical protein
LLCESLHVIKAVEGIKEGARISHWSNELDFNVPICNVYRIVELNEESYTVPSEKIESMKLKELKVTYCPLSKVNEPRESDMPKSSLHRTLFSEHRPFGEGMYAYAR